MKRIKQTVLILSLLTVIFSCENEELVDVHFTHQEYTVVQAEIRRGEQFPGVRFTKTLPLGIPYDINLAELNNITAYLRIDSVQIIPLHYTEKGLYKPLYNFYVESEQVYELFAQRDETFIYARTIIPNEPIVSEPEYNGNDFYLEAKVKSFENEVYAALWAISSVTMIKSEDFFNVSVPDNVSPISNVNVRTSPIPEEYRSSDYDGARFIQVFAFDKSFDAYFNSRTAAQDINDPLVQGGGSVKWNVQGDNTIGMFIGLADGIPQQTF